MQQSELTGYNVHPPADREAMLKSIGADSIDGLFHAIDPSVRLQRRLKLPEALSEWALTRHFRDLANQNATTENSLSFLGGGAYQHHIPEVVRSIASRGEFLTAYTPYQPEMSQGILRVLYDFQTLMARILGLPAVNCSVYDGATALAEASWMACRIRGHRRLVVSATLWPDSLAVLKTYMKGRGVEICLAPEDPDTGQTDVAALQALVTEAPTSAVLLQTPNRYGVVENVAPIVEAAHAAEALAVATCYPTSLGCLRSPGTLGADIVCAEAQPLGLELNAGGPYLGAIATRTEFEPHLPGRIVGLCSDLKGEPALALVKEEREQHVARHEATSHICSNQALLALRVSVYLATVGERGFRQIAQLCAAKAHALREQLLAIPGVRAPKSGAIFNEFLLELPVAPQAILESIYEKERIFAGVDFATFDPNYDRHLLIAVTEVITQEDINRFSQALSHALEAHS